MINRETSGRETSGRETSSHASRTAQSAQLQGPRSASERRGRTRHPLSVPARVRLRGPGIAASPTQILDLSEDGIGVRTSAPLQPERTLALDLFLNAELDGRLPVRLIGQVAWSEPDGRAGVRFFSPDHASLHEIQQWLFLNAVAGAAAEARVSEMLPRVSELTNGQAQSVHVAKIEQFRDEETQESSEPLLSPLERDTNAIVSRALALTGAKGAALALYEGGQLICRAICGTDTPALGARISTDSGITGECIRFQRVMYCSDTGADDRVDREICLDLGIRSILALPLFAGERVVGLLEVLSQRTSAFDPMDAQALDLLARPVISTLFAEGKWAEGKSAEGKSKEMHRAILGASSGSPASLEPSRGGASVHSKDAGFIDSTFLEHRRQALARGVLPATPMRRRIIEAVAALAILAVVAWIVISQTKILASLRQPPVAAAPSPIQPPVSIPPPEIPKMSPEALAELKATAQHGDPSAQYAMGAKYASGEGVAQDYSTAARWFTLAAKKGYAPAQGMLGAYYWSGRGVTKDLKKAYFWSLLAREGNDEISRDRVETLTPRMNRDELLEVQQRVHDWNLKHAVVTAAVSSPGTAASR